MQKVYLYKLQCYYIGNQYNTLKECAFFLFSDSRRQCCGFSQPVWLSGYLHYSYSCKVERSAIIIFNLGVLLAVFLEDELTLEPLVLVLSPPPVLASLSLVLGHFEGLQKNAFNKIIALLKQ